MTTDFVDAIGIGTESKLWEIWIDPIDVNNCSNKFLSRAAATEEWDEVQTLVDQWKQHEDVETGRAALLVTVSTTTKELVYGS